MCGIVGYQPYLPLHGGEHEAFTRLFKESSIRGLHAFGLAQPGLVERSFQIDDIFPLFDPRWPAIAHTRYCQSGDWHILSNNGPIVVGDMALAFNGVIHMGTKEEFEAAFNVKCTVDNDGEIFLRRLEQGQPAAEFLQEITGSFAGTWLQFNRVWAGRNARRPLWSVDYLGARWYASTKDIFRRAEFPDPREVPVGVEHA